MLQGEGSDGGSGGESPAAADGDNPGDAGGPADGGHGSRKESPGRLGRYLNAAHALKLFSNVAKVDYCMARDQFFNYTS